MSALQQRLAALSQQFQVIQQKLQTTVESRQKLEAQSQENESVKAVCPTSLSTTVFPITDTSLQEFEALDEDACIYKLIGPVLVKQDTLEANQNVSRRIDLLKQETSRVEDEIKKVQGEAEKLKGEIIRVQQESLAQENAAEAVAQKT